MIKDNNIVIKECYTILDWFGTLVMREDAPSYDWSSHGPAPLMTTTYNANQEYKTHVSPIYYWFRMD